MKIEAIYYCSECDTSVTKTIKSKLTSSGEIDVKSVPKTIFCNRTSNCRIANLQKFVIPRQAVNKLNRIDG